MCTKFVYTVLKDFSLCLSKSSTGGGAENLDLHDIVWLITIPRSEEEPVSLHVLWTDCNGLSFYILTIDYL